VHTGDIVASIGNAYGHGHPAIGIGPVTHLHRRIASTTDSDSDAPALTGLIQANSNIQPGESGGPMVNQRGEVIGVNVAYVRTPRTGEPTGTGYAIPINRALSVAHHLLAESLTDES
jgi:S1-C subfamily serine protease